MLSANTQNNLKSLTVWITKGRVQHNITLEYIELNN